MLISASVLFLLGMGAFIWLDAKKSKAFPKKFSVTRFLGLNKKKKKKATPDPSIWYTQCGLIRERNRKRERKLKNQASSQLIDSDGNNNT